MAISYNLTFRKFHLSGRQLLDKEGEIVLHEKGFQLKGKGAFDHGELIHFGDVQDIQHNGQSVEFTTFLSNRFVLTNFGNLFDQFVRDLYRVRNEFLIEALFLRQGKLIKNYEGMYELTSQHHDDVQKGRAKIRVYEESLVVIPDAAEAFSVPFSFLKMYEFDEDEYRLQMTLDDGMTVFLSQLGNDFEEFEEQIEQNLSLMYSEILKQFQNFFINHKADILIKLANAMKGGKAVAMKVLQKIDKDLAQAVFDAVFKDEIFLKTLEPLKKEMHSENLFLGLNVLDGKKDHYSFTAIIVMPEKNLMTCTLGSYQGDLRKVQDTYFFRMEDSDVSGAVLDLNQALMLLHFIPDPFYKDKRELQKSLYKLAIRRLPFLQYLREHFLGRCPSILPELFQRNFEKFLAHASEKKSSAEASLVRKK